MKKTGARLGQHFLKHAWAARALAHAAAPRSDETIVEIGPGKGVLTRELLATGASVIAIEKDEKLATLLKETFAPEIANGKLVLVTGDVRDFFPTHSSLLTPHYLVAANIPYYITGEIIRQFLTAEAQPRAMALLVQKEVAKRIVDTKESILSLSVKAYGKPRVVETVPARHFSPPPKVDSAILLIDGISRDFFDDVSETQFFDIVHAGFASKRKMLANNLAAAFGREKAAAMLAATEIPDKARAEDVPLAKWRTLTEKGHSSRLLRREASAAAPASRASSADSASLRPTRSRRK
jgi:16S rRNA (adenine1518-N6/adenine1519-N6)-dimethyltransferase